MKKVIGFANKFYTLWEYEAVDQYTTDVYGNYYRSGVNHTYHYIKNISFDLAKVKDKYPGVDIDTSLCGTRSFTREEKIELPANVFWFGKYYGQPIDDIMESDFQYCLWCVENRSYSNNSVYIKSHPKYIAHFDAIELEKVRKIEEAEKVSVGDVITLSFQRNGYNGWFSDNGRMEYIHSGEASMARYDRCFVDAYLNDTMVTIECPCRPVSGMYPYLMPIINGKAQRTKNKSIEVTVTEVTKTDLSNGQVRQFIKVA